MRFGRRRQRQRAIDHRRDMAGREERPHLRFELARNRALLLDASRPQQRPGDREPILHHGAEIDRGPRRRRAIRAEPGGRTRRGTRCCAEVVAADDVEHDVDAAVVRRATDDLDEVAGFVVDCRCAEALACGALLIRPGSREHLSAFDARELNRRRADAARAAVNEDPLAALQGPVLKEVGPHGEERLGNRRCFERAKSARDRQALRLRRDAVLRVSAARHQRTDGIARSPSS